MKVKETESLSNSTENVYENIKSPVETDSSRKCMEMDSKRITAAAAESVTPLLNGSFKRKDAPSSPGKINRKRRLIHNEEFIFCVYGTLLGDQSRNRFKAIIYFSLNTVTFHNVQNLFS